MTEPTHAAGSVPFHVALDLSGPDQRDPYITCGCVAGYSQQFEAFNRQWAALLRDHALPYLRMSDAISFDGAFRDKADEWGDERVPRRDQLLQQAALVVQNHLFPSSTSFDTRELPPKLKRSKNGKQLAFEVLVRQLVYPLPEYTALHFTCDDDEELAPLFYKGLAAFKPHDQAYARRIAGVCFADDTGLSVLQAADLVAYVDRSRRTGLSSPLEPLLWPEPSGLEDVMATFFPPPERG